MSHFPSRHSVIEIGELLKAKIQNLFYANEREIPRHMKANLHNWTYLTLTLYALKLNAQVKCKHSANYRYSGWLSVDEKTIPGHLDEKVVQSCKQFVHHTVFACCKRLPKTSILCLQISSWSNPVTPLCWFWVFPVGLKIVCRLGALITKCWGHVWGMRPRA